MSKYILGITLLLLAGAGALAQEGNIITTRFGALTISDAGTLLFKGHPLDPPFEEDAGLSLSELKQLGDADVVLVTLDGGKACPALYYFVTVKESGAKITHAFGTCSDLIKITSARDSISVSMPGFAGDFESKRAQRKAALEKHVFIYRAGVVTENGKPVK